VDAAHRVEERGPRLAFERREAVSDLDDPEAQRLGDRGLRQLAVDDGLQDLSARLVGDVGE